MTDEQAMRAVASGDLDKAAVLYERYKRPLMGYFYRQFVNGQHAEDLMQQVFFRIIQYRNSFTEGYVFKPWMFRIARNVFLDHKNQKTSVGLDEIGEVEEEETYDTEQEEQLHKALAKLPVDYREVILLSRYEELKYDEIAEMLQISVSLVKVRVHRGLKILREIYFQME